MLVSSPGGEMRTRRLCPAVSLKIRGVDFSKIAKPMTKLLENGRECKWSDECQASFEELRRRLTSTPILVLPDITQSFDIYCDASRQGLGCMLMQGEKVVLCF